MFDVIFTYTDQKLNTMCQDIEAIGQINSSWQEYSGDELMKHHFTLHRDFYLRGKGNNYIVSCTGLVGVEIRQK